MPDEMDQVQGLNERFQRQALADAIRKDNPLPSRFDCLDCEEPIPEARRKAVPGCQRCIDCQQLHENWRPL